LSELRLKLPELRKEHHLSQRQLAAIAGVRPDTISALERGKTTGIQFDTLARLCEVLDCQPGDLFEFEVDDHQIPVLGGPDEDELILSRLQQSTTLVDGPSFLAELTKRTDQQAAATEAQE
jgi:putative transcriptional regulator